jgi:hypothetical protein
LQALQAVVPENPEIGVELKNYWDSATEPVYSGTNYHRCKCYRTVVLDVLNKLNESRTFMHEERINVSLNNDLLRNKCGINDWNQLCGAIVLKNSPEGGSIQLDWKEHKSTHFKGRRLGAAAIGPCTVSECRCTGPTSNYNLLNTDVITS